VKKYILFKLDPVCTKTEEDVRFAQLELEAFFPSVKPLSTVFEILNYSDIKTLVEHDTTIQRLLTQDLSHGPYQVFLAIDETGLAIEKAIKRLAYVGDIILLQRSHDNMILYLQYLLTNHMASLHTVFNWHIFQVSSLQKQLQQINTLPVYFAYGTYSDLDERQIRALINWTISEPGVFYDASSNGSMAAVYAAEMDISTYTSENDLYLPRLQALVLDNTLIAKGLHVLIERLNELLRQKKDRQSHLFFNDVNTLFTEYRNTHLKKIKSKQQHKLDHLDQETILAIKFLIENNIITAHQSINNLLYYLVIHAVTAYHTNHPGQNFLPYLKEYFKHFQELQQVYLNIREQYAQDTGEVRFVQENKSGEKLHVNGIINLSRINKAFTIPVIETFFSDSIAKASTVLLKKIPEFHDYKNDEIKNLGAYTGKSLLYLKSINAHEDFTAIGTLYFKFKDLLENAQAHLKPLGRLCVTVHSYITPVLELNVDALFADIADKANLSLLQVIPLDRKTTGKKIYIVLFENRNSQSLAK
jgi:hypothetical protein